MAKTGVAGRFAVKLFQSTPLLVVFQTLSLEYPPKVTYTVDGFLSNTIRVHIRPFGNLVGTALSTSFHVGLDAVAFSVVKMRPLLYAIQTTFEFPGITAIALIRRSGETPGITSFAEVHEGPVCSSTAVSASSVRQS